MSYKDFPQYIIDEINRFLKDADNKAKYPDEHAFLLQVKESLIKNKKFSNNAEAEKCAQVLSKVIQRKGPKEPWDDNEIDR